MSKFPHPITITGDTNADGAVNMADLSNVMANFGKTPKPQPGPSLPPQGWGKQRLLYVQISAPHIGDIGPGWNSPPGLPWLNVGEHGVRRVWERAIRAALEGGLYTGVCLSGLSGVQDEFTAAHGSRNHGFVSFATMSAALGPLSNDAAELVFSLTRDGYETVVYCGGSDKPIFGNTVVGPSRYATDGENALKGCVDFAHATNSRAAFDAMSWWPMANHPGVVESVFRYCGRRPITEGPAEHADPATLAKLMSLCDEIGMVNDGPGGWLANSPHAKLMLNPARRAWKAVNAPTCREYWMCNGAFSATSRDDIEATAAKYGITLIDQMRAKV